MRERSDKVNERVGVSENDLFDGMDRVLEKSLEIMDFNVGLWGRMCFLGSVFRGGFNRRGVKKKGNRERRRGKGWRKRKGWRKKEWKGRGRKGRKNWDERSDDGVKKGKLFEVLRKGECNWGKGNKRWKRDRKGWGCRRGWWKIGEECDRSNRREWGC